MGVGCSYSKAVLRKLLSNNWIRCHTISLFVLLHNRFRACHYFSCLYDTKHCQLVLLFSSALDSYSLLMHFLTNHHFFFDIWKTSVLKLLVTDALWIIPTLVLSIVCAVRETEVQNAWNGFLDINIGAFGAAAVTNSFLFISIFFANSIAFLMVYSFRQIHILFWLYFRFLITFIL